ncbi:MAG: hypothetical protein CME86_06770 [Herbaspirillum sp.]|nr:hypothetical protein [Herbaspirillum sp.]
MPREVLIVDGNPLILNIPHLNRNFDYEFLRKAFSAKKARELAMSLTLFHSSYSRDTAVQRYHAFKGFIADAPDLAKKHFGTRRLDRIIETDAWGQLAHIWLAAREAHYGNERVTTFVENSSALKRCFDRLYQAGLAALVPPYDNPKYYHRFKKRTLSLVEREAQATLKKVEPELEETLNEVAEVLKKHDASISDEELQGFLRSFAKHGENDRIAPDQLLELMVRRTSYLLEYIRRLGEVKVLYWSKVYEEGQKLLELADSDAKEQLVAAYNLPPLPRRKQISRKRRLSMLFPKNNNDKALANLLRIVLDLYGGNFPGAKEFINRTLHNQLMKRFGGRYYVSAMISAHQDAVAGAALMYMVDSGANVSTALVMAPEFESESEYDGHIKINSVKARALGAQIINNLPIVDPIHELSTVQALRAIKRMTSTLRSAEEKLKSNLFVHQFFQKPSIATHIFLASRLRYFQRDDKTSDVGHLTPGGIRISFLMHATIRKEGAFYKVVAAADHVDGKGMTERYSQKWPVRVRYVEEIRQFTKTLENQLILNLTDARRQFGRRDAAEILEKAERTGLGMSCKLKTDNQRDEAKSDCPGIGACPSCDHKLVHASDENIYDMVVANRWLRENQTRLETTATAKWTEMFIPIFAFTEVVIEKLSRSRHAKKLEMVRRSVSDVACSPLEFLG